jgi:hypothetical protein
MVNREPIEVENLSIYGTDALEWSRPRDILEAGPGADVPNRDFPTVLGTVRPDGTPHANFVGAFWHDGDIYFTSSPNSRKSKNLDHNPRASIAMHLPGIDMVFEGVVTRVTDSATLERVAQKGREGGWPAKVDGDALTAPFSAPSAGPPPWYVYRLRFDTAVGVAGEEPWGATRWTFDS